MSNKVLFGGNYFRGLGLIRREDLSRGINLIRNEQIDFHVDNEFYRRELFEHSRAKNNKTYGELVFGVHIRRRPLYYIFNVIIPCAMLSCLTCMSFW